MNKLLAIGITIGIVVILNLIMLIVVPFLADIAATSNATMAATSNMSNYPGASEVLLAAPWWLYVALNALGIVSIVVILRAP